MSEPEKPKGRPMPGTTGMGTHEVDVHEYGAEKDGARQKVDERLFMQLLVFEVSGDRHAGEVSGELAQALTKAGVASVIYDDVNNPQGLAVLTWSRNPDHFVTKLRPVLQEASFRTMRQLPEYTMMGRTYATGYERELAYWILERPIEQVNHEGWDWAVWYPLKRKGPFNRLPGKDQGGILREHAVIGRAYGEAGLAHDVRLACFGIDANDNEYVIGLIGQTLFPLSHVVQAMRKTRQTAEYMDKMGPFFIGRVAARTHAS
ncbi:MAG: chlorite dismutase family protein [Myxococcota bacterium]